MRAEIQNLPGYALIEPEVISDPAWAGTDGDLTDEHGPLVRFEDDLDVPPSHVDLGGVETRRRDTQADALAVRRQAKSTLGTRDDSRLRTGRANLGADDGPTIRTEDESRHRNVLTRNQRARRQAGQQDARKANQHGRILAGRPGAIC